MKPAQDEHQAGSCIGIQESKGFSSPNTTRIRMRFPHPLVLLFACTVLAAVLSHVVPAGEFERRKDSASGRTLVVPGSYHRVPANPVGFFQTFIAVPQGMGKASEIIFLIFLVGGAFSVVDRTGTLRAGVGWLSGQLDGRELLLIPICCIVFAIGGVVEGMFEEIIALLPVLVLLARRLGFDRVTALAMSLGAANIGGTFSSMNPFNVGLGQKLADLPLMSGTLFRMAVLIPALGIWTGGTLWHAFRTRSAKSDVAEDRAEPFKKNHLITLVLMIACFATYVFGAVKYEWGFDELSGLFFAMGIAAGLIGGLGVTGTAEAFVEGFRSMALAALIVGVARAIYVVLDEGRIVDTMIQALVSPLSHLPNWLFGAGMTVVQTLISIPVPSSSGQATLTLPILVPVSDLLGVSRQVTVLAYQYGNGVLLFLPTHGALMAMLSVARVRYGDWIKFAVPLSLILFVYAVVAVGIAAGIGVK
jgi:uncharacterized ion transporter superfamily protein YfcC